MDLSKILLNLYCCITVYVLSMIYFVLNITELFKTFTGFVQNVIGIVLSLNSFVITVNWFVLIFTRLVKFDSIAWHRFAFYLFQMWWQKLWINVTSWNICFQRIFSKHRPSWPMLSLSRFVHMFFCLLVCVLVCVFTFEVRFKRLLSPLPKARCPKS